MLLTLVALTVLPSSTLRAAEHPVKELKEIERIVLGKWTSETKLDENVEGFADKGATVQSHDDGHYDQSKSLLYSTTWLSNGDKKFESLRFYLSVDSVTGNVKFWVFDLITGGPISGQVYVDGDTYYLRGEGEFLPRTEEEKKEYGTEVVPWNSEMMATVEDADTVKWKLNYVKFKGKPVEYPGVGEESINKRAK